MEEYECVVFEQIAYINGQGNKGYSLEALEHVWTLIMIRVHEFPKWFRQPSYTTGLNEYE